VLLAALARDVPYRRYGHEPITAAAIADLRRFADHRDLDARTLFRSTDPGLPGVATGPYVSPFLVQPYTLGSTPTERRYRTTVAGSDHLTSYDAWLAVQNGQPATATARYDPTPRLIRNGRDLGEWSHRDFSYQGPLVACLILLGYLARYGPQVLAEANPFRDHPTKTVGVTFGAPDVPDQVARSANAAMKAAWYHKWLVHRRLRPEETGGRIHNHLTGAAAYPPHPKLTDSAVLDRLYAKHGSYLCPQAYPRAARPTRPTRGPRPPSAGRGAGAQGVLQPQLRGPRAGGAQRRRAVAAALAGRAADGGWGAEQAGVQHGLRARHRRGPLPQRRGRRDRARRVIWIPLQRARGPVPASG